MKNIKFLTQLICVIFLFIMSNGCDESQYSVSESNFNSKLKINVPADINGHIEKEMVGKNITNISNRKGKNITSGGLEDQYLIDDFNNDGYADIAVRRGNLIIIDANRDGVSDIAFTYGNGSSERGYYTSNGGIAIVRGNSIYIDDNLDGLTDRSFTYGNGNSEAEYIFLKPSGVAVRRADISPVANHILIDYNMNGMADVDFYWGNGNSESQYAHGFPSPSSGGWGLRRNYTWYFYNMIWTYIYGLGDSEDGYFLGEYSGNGNYSLAVLRGNTLYYDTNWDGQHDGTFSFGTGLK